MSLISLFPGYELNTDGTLKSAASRRVERTHGGRSDAAFVAVAGRQLPILYCRNPLARRYRLFVNRDGQPRVTVPRCGSIRVAEEFVLRHLAWLTRQVARVLAQREEDREWEPGAQILFRGELVRIELVKHEGHSFVRFTQELFPIRHDADGGALALRACVEACLWDVARRELPVRAMELATVHGLAVGRVTVRNQRSRWGSCSRRGTISLNWRLVQTPPDVRDYIVVHELMHLREMNHSSRFWAHVAAAFPGYRESERWLNSHGRLLL